MNLVDCINIIKNCTTLACEYHIKDKCNYSYEVRENRFECAKEQAIKALEKQIPKKPIFKEGDCYAMSKDGTKLHEIIPECPNCHSIALKHSYPCRCGQILDWEN